jgi:hypothetical protein
LEELRERDHLKDLGIDGKIILQLSSRTKIRGMD